MIMIKQNSEIRQRIKKTSNISNGIRNLFKQKHWKKESLFRNWK